MSAYNREVYGLQNRKVGKNVPSKKQQRALICDTFSENC